VRKAAWHGQLRRARPVHTFLPRWVVPLLGAVALGLVPWTLWLTFTLPSRHVTEHYDVAWVGFDVVLAASFVATVVTAVKFSPWLEATAAVTGTLLVCDAWFDIVTSADSGERLIATIEAVCAELPLAAVCVFIVWDAQRFHDETLGRLREVRGKPPKERG
jgi:hypothetical protein